MTTAWAIGHVTLDAYPDGDRPGGSVLYAGRTLCALGAEVRGLTVANPRPHLDAGFPLEVMPALVTTRFANTYDPDGNRAQVRTAAAPNISPAMLPPSWTTPDLAFLCPVLGELDARPWINALGEVPWVGAGLQGWLKSDEDGRVRHGPDGCDPRQFEGLRVAFLSEEDLAGRLGWLDALCAAVPLVYLTRGEHGAVAFRSDLYARLGVFPTEVVDPTGAGDTFAAATLLALAQGADPVSAGRLGAAAASVVVEHQAAAPVRALRMAAGRVGQIG